MPGRLLLVTRATSSRLLMFYESLPALFKSQACWQWLQCHRHCGVLPSYFSPAFAHNLTPIAVGTLDLQKSTSSRRPRCPPA